MAQGDILVYNDLKEQLFKKVHDFVNDTIRITLHSSYSPNVDSHQVRSDVSSTEYSTGAGYTANGVALASKAVTQDNTNDRGAFDAADVTWTSLGPLSPATPSHAIIWNDTPTSPTDPLICAVELGSTATNGGNYTIAWHANGILLAS